MRLLVFLWLFWTCAGLEHFATAAERRPRLVVGSKAFTESVILGEIVAQVAEAAGAEVRHRRQLGGTQFLWQALVKGEIDIYPEYTGTLTQEIFAGKNLRTSSELRAALASLRLRMSRPLGFDNTYALGMREETAKRYGVETISDLGRHPLLIFGFSNEFMDRADGWPALRRTYGLAPRRVQGLHHDLAYRGLESGAIDVTDLYSTDAEIAYYRLRVLEDDRHHFPSYHAVLLYRQESFERMPNVLGSVLELEAGISQERMVAMNAEVKLQKNPGAEVAQRFTREVLAQKTRAVVESWQERIWRHGVEHIYLVGVSLLAAIFLSIPLGVLAARHAVFGQVLLGGVAVVQTIPSLALLVFMIPLLGIGERPAIAALFLYSLLPIVRNTYAGLGNIAPSIRESAQALGLREFAQLRLVYLPIASRTILAGIKTSAVINVGTATLGALIGAGGYGQPILTGIRLNDTGLILQGAVPAALLALGVQFLFEAVDHLVIPRGLRLQPERPA